MVTNRVAPFDRDLEQISYHRNFPEKEQIDELVWRCFMFWRRLLCNIILCLPGNSFQSHKLAPRGSQEFEALATSFFLVLNP